MAYNKGNSHKIQSMASKSCNGVNQRNLYAPLTANYSISGRNYTITVSLACYFGTRININNSFSNIIINGTNRNNKTINGWVSQEEPGVQIASLSISGSFNADGSADIPTRVIEASGTMTYYSDVACHTQKTINFSNSVELNISPIAPSYTSPSTPVLTNVVYGAGFITGTVSTESFGEGGGKFLSVEVSRDNFSTVYAESNIITDLSGNFKIPNLPYNWECKIRGKACNNGLCATSSPTTGHTIAASEIYSAFASYASNHLYLSVSGLVFGGSQDGNPVTYIDYSSDLSNWSEADSTSSLDNFSSNVSLSWDQEDERVYIRTRTVDGSFSYTSGYIDVSVGDRNSLWGYIDSIVPSVNTAQINMVINSPSSNNVTAKIYIRLAGIEEEWSQIGQTTIAGGSNVNLTYTISNLNQNNYEYEVSVELAQSISGSTVKYNTDPKTFYTIPYAMNNNTCDSISYMADLICQSLEAIKHGNISLFMNNDTKKWCEMDDDDTPTIASMMSRVARFLHAISCLLCTMEGFEQVSQNSSSSQVFMGKLGWTEIDDEVTDGSKNPVFSNAIKIAIDNLVSSVWHYVGDYDYFGYDLADLQSQQGTANNQEGIVGNQKYKWNGTSWANPTTVTNENFGVIHIKYGTHADKGYYWFKNGWDRLDADTSEIEDRIEVLEETKTVGSIDSSEYILAIVPSSWSDAQIIANVPTNVTKNTIVIVKEDE